MSDLKTPRGFEEGRVFEPSHVRSGRPVLPPGLGRGRLARLASGAPEVMMKVNGRIHGGGQLRAHLDYISRKGELELEDQDRSIIAGRSAVRDLADDWGLAARLDVGARANTPIVLALVPSMPPGTDPAVVRDATRDFAHQSFSGQFAMVLHTDAPNPHVHLTIRWLGDDGKHLRPGPAELRSWRGTFAQALRDRGVEAEATPRWLRGVTLRAERTPIRKMREAYEMGEGPLPRVLAGVYRDAYRAAFGGEAAPNQWEQKIIERQSEVREFFNARVEELAQSPDAADRALGQKVEAFVSSMPNPDSQRLSAARQIRAAELQHHPEMARDLKHERGLRKGLSR